MTKNKKGRGTMELEQIKYLSKEIEVTLNVAITEKQLGIPGPQGAFSDKVILDIDGFTDKTVVQCDV